tara:strand:- start:1028 stop:1756 length:729 start_codon:yes stop_codon:yes gene_type:complete
MAAKKKIIPKSMGEAKLKVYSTIGCVEHDAKQGHRNYTYTSHEAVTASVVPAMYEAGITVRFKCSGLTVMDSFALFKCTATFFHHDSGEEEKCSVYAGDRLRDGTTMGSIMSYAVKIIYVKYFGLSTGDRDLEEIQSEQESINHTLMKQKGLDELAAAKSKKAEEEAPWDEGEETAEIFDGEVMSSPEEQLEFVSLCKEFDLTDDMIDKRLEFEGIDKLENVPKNLMKTWIDQMQEKLDAQD